MRPSTLAAAEARPPSPAMEMLLAVARLADSREPGMARHAERVRQGALIVADRLASQPEYASIVDETFLNGVYAAAPLHDIGKLGVPESVLLKPDRLGNADFDIVRRHSAIGADALRPVAEAFDEPFVHMALQVAESHHERWDGRGYVRPATWVTH